MRFDSYHPLINLIYFTVAIACTVSFQHPIFLSIAFICAFAYSLKLRKTKGLVWNLTFTVLGIAYSLWYAYYNHFGVTGIRTNFIGNRITVESLAYGLVIGITIATVLMWLQCIFTLITADKVVYLFGRISPKLSLFISVLLRSVPRIGVRAKRINISRQGIGKGSHQGNVFDRINHMFSMLSILITWTMEDFVESANSMKSRGYSLKGRTAFSIYRFDNRDRGLVIGFFACVMIIVSAVMFGETYIYYDPMIVMNQITPVSVVFYVVYGIFLLLPLTLQIVGEWRFSRNSVIIAKNIRKK